MFPDRPKSNVSFNIASAKAEMQKGRIACNYAYGGLIYIWESAWRHKWHGLLVQFGRVTASEKFNSLARSIEWFEKTGEAMEI